MRFSMLVSRWGLLILLIIAVETAVADSGDSDRGEWDYFSLDVGPLVANEDNQQIVSDVAITRHAWYQMDSTPRVFVPSGSEAYLLIQRNENDNFDGYKIIGRKPSKKPLSGHFYVLRPDPTKATHRCLARYDFDVDGELKIHGNRDEFLLAKGRHFQRLWSEQMAGGAMFRHLATETLSKVGETAVSTGPNWPTRSRDKVDDTIRLMSGGRAVSENLQLDRQLATSSDQGRWRSLSDVRGVTIREINWKPLLQDQPTELDPLSLSIPHDQYAVFLPSFESLATIIQQGNELAKPVVQWIEPQSRETNVLGFYQQQLGLPLNALTRQVGGALIDEVALTGSDPYFRTGTDLAVLMQSKQPKFLEQAIVTQITSQAALHDGVSKVQHNFTGHSVTEWSTSDRSFCSLVSVTDNAVVVSNSLSQVMKVLNAADQKSKTLGSLDEYRFFRQRYPRHAADESALVIISDATIRRWCSPQWRIAASRRTRARATIAEMTMRHADELVLGKVDRTRQLTLTGSLPDAGNLSLTPSGVRSEKYGTLQFQTPISEMDMQLASVGEIKLYETWRNQYERQWRNAFDPIAVKLSLDPRSVSADVSVIPLTIRSQYRTWLSFVGSARLKPSAGDQHQETLASVDLAVNMQSMPIALVRMFLSQQTGNTIDLLSWIDGSFSLYLDRDQEWMKRVAQLPPFEEKNEQLLRELPIGFYVPSKNNLMMTAFIVAARGMLDQFSPNMIRWEQAEHNGLNYVIATAIEGNGIGRPEDMPQAYYVTTPEGLTISLNKNVIQRAIDRHLARKKDRKPEDDASEDPAVDSELAGAVTEEKAGSDEAESETQIAARITGEGTQVLAMSQNSNNQRHMSRLAWSNVPILNYLRHRYPERDPFDVYQQLLGEKLTEPGGGQYEWSDRFQTYQSTHFGHHLAPQVGPAINQSLIGPKDQFESELSFDNGGLRAILKMTRGGK